MSHSQKACCVLSSRRMRHHPRPPVTPPPYAPSCSCRAASVSPRPRRAALSRRISALVFLLRSRSHSSLAALWPRPRHPPPSLFRVAPSPVFLPRLERRSQKMFHVKHLFTCRMTLQQVFHVKHSLLFVRLAPARPQYAPVLPSSLPPQRFPICSRLALRLAHNSLPSPLPPRPQRFPVCSRLAWGSARGVFRWNEVFPRAFSLE